MENIALIGIDLGKNSFHVHCQDRHGKAVYRKKFTRPKLIEFLATCPATTIAMEACGGSHFMARRLTELGHIPKLISPQFVRLFVKSNKNDFVDAEAICEAASRPSMRFVQPKTESQQAMRALHRVREYPGFRRPSPLLPDKLPYAGRDFIIQTVHRQFSQAVVSSRVKTFQLIIRQFITVRFSDFFESLFITAFS